MENSPADNDQVPLKIEAQADSAKELYNFLLWVRRLTVLALAVSIYQIIASAIHLSDWKSSLHKIEVTESCFTIILILIIIKRVIASFNSNNHQDTLLDTGSKEQNLYFISCIFLAAIKVVVVLNAYIQSSYVLEYLTAVNSNHEKWVANFGSKTISEVSSTLLNLRIAYIICNILLACYFLLVARGLFFHITNKKQAISNLIYTANIVTITFALIAISQIHVALGYQAYPYLKGLNSASSLNRLSAGLLVVVLLCFFSWATNFRRWKAGYFIFSVIFCFVSLYIATTAGFTYRGARATKNFYLTHWHDRMEMVHENELNWIGCPSKYTSEKCSTADEVNKWETTKAVACLNSACAGLLSQLYSNEFLTLSNSAIIALAFLTIVGGGFYYFWYISPREPHNPIQNDYVWLLLLILVTIVVTLTYKLSKNQLIYEFTDEKGHF